MPRETFTRLGETRRVSAECIMYKPVVRRFINILISTPKCLYFRKNHAEISNNCSTLKISSSPSTGILPPRCMHAVSIKSVYNFRNLSQGQMKRQIDENYYKMRRIYLSFFLSHLIYLYTQHIKTVLDFLPYPPQ